MTAFSNQHNKPTWWNLPLAYACPSYIPALAQTWLPEMDENIALQ